MATLEAVPRVDAGRPAYVIATWNNNGIRRATVAIEGTTSLGQYADVAAGIGVASTLVGTGRVFSTFQTRAQQILLALNLNANLNAVKAVADAPIIWTGFSLGAAIAEYCGQASYVIGGRRPISVYKFGSPRVGNRTWVSACEQNNSRTGFYCGNDRIDLLPFTTPSGQVAAPLQWETAIVSYERDVHQGRFDRFGAEFGDTLQHTLIAHLDVVRRIRVIGDPPDPWADHDYNVYRYMMTSFARALTPLNYKRFAFVEFADDNSWGVRFPTARGVVSGTAFLADPPPADEVVAVDGQVEDALTRYYAGRPAPLPAMPAAPRQVTTPPRPLGTWEPRRVRDY